MNRNELTRLFALANEFKEGDLPVGGTRDDQLRAEARKELASLRIGDITNAVFIEDQITESIHRAIDSDHKADLDRLTVADLKRILLGPDVAAWARQYRDSLSSETIAAVAKVMTNTELGEVSRALFNPLPGDGIAVGSQLHFGSRIQPNSPATIPTRSCSRFWKAWPTDAAM